MYLILSKSKNTEDVSSISRAACHKSGKDRERSGDGEINGDRMRILGISVRHSGQDAASAKVCDLGFSQKDGRDMGYIGLPHFRQWFGLVVWNPRTPL